MRRRVFLSGAILTGAGLPVLAGCDLPGVSKDKGGSASPSGSIASRPATAGSAQAGSTQWQKLDGHVMGHKVSVEVSGLLGVFRTVLVLCFRLPSSGPGNRFRPRSGCDTLGLSEGGHDCISVRSMRQYR